MYKPLVFLFITTMVLAQDLDSILLDIYGPDINTNMIHKGSGEMERDGMNTDYAHPVPNDHQLARRQASSDGGENIASHYS
ncbi:hypothetical protein ABMA27_012755 [Loxostege sticticalis]|uniref:Uncharacterized protein n=1 Tax=Loxostege sticticalis TaxID=481309 RepID=A0ABR3GZN8_LOXSC